MGLKSNGTIVAWGDNTYGQCTVPEPNTHFIAIDGAFFHSLGLKSNGTIVAWGDNSFAQCTVPEPNTNFVAVTAGVYFSLGLKSDGAIVAWGKNTYGQCTVPEPNTNFVAVTAGVYFSLGLKSNGTIVAWGDDSYGQCTVPEPNTNFVAISAGDYHSMGLKSDGTIVAWGDDSYGQCTVPEPNTHFIAISAGDYFSMGLRSDGTIAAWGFSGWGQTNVPKPNMNFGWADSGITPYAGSWTGGYDVVISGTNLGNGSDVTQVTLCGVSAAITSQSDTQVVVTAGVSGSGGIGDVCVFSTSYGQTTRAKAFWYMAQAIQVTGSNFPPVSVGSAVTTTFTVANSGELPLLISGSTNHGAGGAYFDLSAMPGEVDAGTSSTFPVIFTPEAVGTFDPICYTINDSLESNYCIELHGSCYQLSTNLGPYAGGNTITITNGHFGLITNVTIGGVAATIQQSGDNWVTMTAPAVGSNGVKNIVIQTSDNGDITLANAYTVNPAGVIIGPTSLISDHPIAAGGLHSLGVKSDGAIVGWGDNTYGQLTVPEPNTNFVAVAAGYYHSLGLKSNGTIVAWGDNTYGQLTVPEPNTNFVAVAAGRYHSLGLKSDGTIVAWGDDTYGQLTVPEPNTNFVAVTAGEYVSLGLKSDGAIVAWGRNDYSQTTVPEPNTNFVAMSAGTYDALGLKSDGTIVKWGNTGYVVPTPNTNFVATASGVINYLGLKSNHTIVAWGQARSSIGTSIPQPNTNFLAIAIGTKQALGLKSDGSIVAWGSETNKPEPNANFGITVGASVTPSAGSCTGGYPVVIFGVHLGDGSDITNVTLCGVSAAITSQSDSQVTVTAGVGTPGQGDVSVYSTSYGQTVKSNAFTYIAPDIVLAIESAYGAGIPPVGVYTQAQGTVLTNSMSDTDTQDATQYICAGWAMTGNEPASGTDTQMIMTVTNDAVLTWLWTTNYGLDTDAGEHGSVNVGDGWQAAGVTTQITATADLYYHFTNWTGDVSGGDVFANPLNLLMDGSKYVTAHFAADVTTNTGVPYEWLAQYGFTGDYETVAGQDLNSNGYSTAEDYILGLDPTNPASTFRPEPPTPLYGTNGFEVVWTNDEPPYEVGTQVVYDVVGMLLSWPSVSGRVYDIESSGILPDGHWEGVAGAQDIAATPPMNYYTNSIPQMTNVWQFFREKVRLAP